MVHVLTAEHVTTLGRWCAGLCWDDVPTPVQQRLRLVLLDVLSKTLIGAREPDQARLVAAWTPQDGPAPVVGAHRCTGVESAAWLNATALVGLELDEGHKFAKGHPAAHGFPAVLALAAAQDVEAETLLIALLVAYEVAARFGRATTLRPGLHPHGSWGVTGAAAGCARLLGLDVAATAAAIDAGSAMPIAGHFASALDGNRVRDQWMGAANVSGLAAARMAAAGLAATTGSAAYSLGEALGAFDPQFLTDALGERWEIALGYFKQHAACSFTHPAADAVLELRAQGQLPAASQVEDVLVETHSLAAGLDSQQWTNRLAAMFSIPFVVAAALVHGHVEPSVSQSEAVNDPTVRALAARVRVVVAPDLDDRLPDERAVRVTIHGAGRTLRAQRPNPVGDSAFHPFDDAALSSLLDGLLAPHGIPEVLTTLLDDLFTGNASGACLRVLAADAVSPTRTGS